jgi:hypothetical protein
VRKQRRALTRPSSSKRAQAPERHAEWPIPLPLPPPAGHGCPYEAKRQRHSNVVVAPARGHARSTTFAQFRGERSAVDVRLTLLNTSARISPSTLTFRRSLRLLRSRLEKSAGPAFDLNRANPQQQKVLSAPIAPVPSLRTIQLRSCPNSIFASSKQQASKGSMKRGFHRTE